MFLTCPICGCAVAEGEIPCCGPRVPLLRPETALAELRQDVRHDLVTVADALTAERARIEALEGAIDELRQVIDARDKIVATICFCLGEVAAATHTDDAVRKQLRELMGQTADFLRGKGGA